MSVGPGQGAPPHHDVAPYALGVLDDDEASRFEEHLAHCDACARELESFLPVVDLLADVRLPAADLPPRAAEVPGDELGRRRVRAERRGSRPSRAGRGLPARVARSARSALRRPAVAAAVAAVAAAGVTAGITGNLGPERSTTTPGISAAASSGAPGSSGPWDRLRGPDLATGHQVSASDPATGVRADLILNGAPWGTRVTFALSHVSGPQTCRLVAVRRGGGTEVLSTWVVPAEGYGTAKQPQPLVLQAATALARTDIAELRVESVAPSGTHDLVTISA
ncbi:MAG: anti-sigma factor family protein [Kineosporiaceae bacterium]